MKRLAMLGSLLCVGAALADPPSTSERVLVLRADDYIGSSVVTSGTGRALWSGASAMLHKRGIPALSGDAASLARGIDEAGSKQCTVIAVPEFTHYKLGKKELEVGIRIVWFGLDRTERARCEQKSKIPVEKDKNSYSAELALSAVETCLNQVYGPAPVKSPIRSPWLRARYDMVYATKPDDERYDSPRFGDAAASLADVARELDADRDVLVTRVYGYGSKLIQRFELYPAGVAAEAQAQIADIEIGSRLRGRLEDRALEGLLAALRARGADVPDLAQLAIPASDPLDKIITLVPVVLPEFDPSRGLDFGIGLGTGLWVRLSVAADGTVQDVVALNGQSSPAIEEARHKNCTPGTRGGQPEAMPVITYLIVLPSDHGN